MVKPLEGDEVWLEAGNCWIEEHPDSAVVGRPKGNEPPIAIASAVLASLLAHRNIVYVSW